MQDEKYEPLKLEKKWQKIWEDKDKFKPTPSDKQFSIVIPPPNVTGSLNMGHALEHSIIDVCLLYTSPSPRDRTRSRMPSSA